MKTIYDWTKYGDMWVTYLAIPKPSQNYVLRSHKATYYRKTKCMVVSDGAISTWFKVKNRSEAEAILMAFRSTEAQVTSVGLIGRILKEII